MIVECMHCRKELHEVDGQGVEGKSSGICEPCIEEHYHDFAEAVIAEKRKREGRRAA
jgi:hypothetical protein